MGGAIPRLMVLGTIRKHAEQAIMIKRVNRTLPWPSYQALLPGSCPDQAPILTSVNDGIGNMTWKLTMFDND